MRLAVPKDEFTEVLVNGEQYAVVLNSPPQYIFIVCTSGDLNNGNYVVSNVTRYAIMSPLTDSSARNRRGCIQLAFHENREYILVCQNGGSIGKRGSYIFLL
jgi:hypothetical protein